jgi:hypothetical protein
MTDVFSPEIGDDMYILHRNEYSSSSTTRQSLTPKRRAVHTKNYSKMMFIVLVLAFVAVALATTGVDVSQRTSLSSWQCVHNYGYSFAIVRVYCSNGSPDSNGPANINDAWNAGFAHVDGYIFPCYSCGNPAGQVRT